MGNRSIKTTAIQDVWLILVKLPLGLLLPVVSGRSPNLGSMLSGIQSAVGENEVDGSCYFSYSLGVLETRLRVMMEEDGCLI
ncbi:hypothetical protein F2Q69_00021582 [Brassica cretica]|uniref:Uncharacterized protein n=1 Tax=Brassica cretica TaxID=69181 RepID=A0A8S9Q905_BRACR|nr:hypothetical protein F2Q69_00021582 [Brassica cretica]